jgi:DNA-binding GntR family transcriptional regulator
MAFQANNPPTPQQLRHWVAEQLRTAIFEGDLKPGEWLRQERMAQEYGVSQMPVREALKELTAEGLVEHVPYRGVRVVEFSADDVQDLYAHRSFLEGMAARGAARAITAEELAELGDVLAHMKKRLAPRHLAEYRALNRRFHTIICHASRRAYLIRTLNQMWAAFPTMLLSNFAQTAQVSLPERDDSDIQEHEAIVAALERHDATLAEQLMRQHIQASGHKLASAIRSSE